MTKEEFESLGLECGDFIDCIHTMAIFQGYLIKYDRGESFILIQFDLGKDGKAKLELKHISLITLLEKHGKK